MINHPRVERVRDPVVGAVEPRVQEAQGSKLATVLVRDGVVRIVGSRPVVLETAEDIPRQPRRGLHPYEPATPRRVREDRVELRLAEVLLILEVVFVAEVGLQGENGRPEVDDLLARHEVARRMGHAEPHGLGCARVLGLVLVVRLEEVTPLAGDRDAKAVGDPRHLAVVDDPGAVGRGGAVENLLRPAPTELELTSGHGVHPDAVCEPRRVRHFVQAIDVGGLPGAIDEGHPLVDGSKEHVVQRVPDERVVAGFRRARGVRRPVFAGRGVTGDPDGIEVGVARERLGEREPWLGSGAGHERDQGDRELGKIHLSHPSKCSGHARHQPDGVDLPTVVEGLAPDSEDDLERGVLRPHDGLVLEPADWSPKAAENRRRPASKPAK